MVVRGLLNEDLYIQIPTVFLPSYDFIQSISTVVKTVLLVFGGLVSFMILWRGCKEDIENENYS